MEKKINKVYFNGTYFYHFDGEDLGDIEIQQMIDEVLDYLIAHQDESFYFIATGNTIVLGLVFSESGEISILVAKNYYEACLDRVKNGNYEAITY